MVLPLASAPAIAAARAFLSAVTQNMSFFGPSSLAGILTQPIALLAIVLFILWIAFLGYWLYRICGELAGASASQHLLTLRAASMLGRFVPFGMSVILVTVGELLNSGLRTGGKHISISNLILLFCTLLLPPVAIAMIQHAANKSFTAHG